MHENLPHALKYTRDACPLITAQVENIVVAGSERYVFTYHVFVSVRARLHVFVYVCVCVYV